MKKNITYCTFRMPSRVSSDAKPRDSLGKSAYLTGRDAFFGIVAMLCNLARETLLLQHKYPTQCSSEGRPIHCSMHNDSRPLLTNSGAV